MENANQNYRVTAASALVAELTTAAGSIGDVKPHQRKILVARAAAAIETQRELLDIGKGAASLPTGIVSDLDMLRRESASLPDALAAQILRQVADEIRRLADLVKQTI
ncbi:hypothetical protein [Neorhizobium sp. BT27B]|uniref:hypothetical protein n=1 Tax=Neorhizobium sp. BT27B TaxID=3142625 RepID=UPI0010D742E6|nr:hypothetical protein EDF70_101935 [Neorhizobium sp. JUb45]